MRFAPLALLAALCIAAPAHAQRLAPPESHEGLYLRIEGGVGYLHSTANYDGATATSYGGAGMLGLAVGGAIAPNVVIFGELWGIGAANPTVKIGGSTGTANNTTLNYGGIGPGVGFFFMPSNVFLGISLDFTRLGVTNSDGSQSDSDLGLALKAQLGKQFWISPRWGLGVSLEFIGGGNRDNNNDNNSATYQTYTGLAALTLTYG